MVKIDEPGFELPSPNSAALSVGQEEANNQTERNNKVMEQSKRGLDVENMTLHEARRILHRRIRYGTACWPCRLRKVKCERKQPCENCVKRDHPQLCAYQPKRSTKSTAKPPLHDLSTSSVKGKAAKGSRKLTGCSRLQTSQPPPVKSLELEQNLKKPTGLAKKVVNIDLEPMNIKFQKTMELSDSSPPGLASDYEVLRLFQTFKEIPHFFWEFIMDIDDTELKVLAYLDKRSKNPRQSENWTSSWLALLNSILAVGAQYQESPYHIRKEHSNSYTQAAFYFLHLGNSLRKPTFEHVQALLLLSFVLLNNAEVSSSRAILDLTCSLARSIGLYDETYEDLETDESLVKEDIRRRFWWTCFRHRALISQFCGNCLLGSNILAQPDQSIEGPEGAFASHPIASTLAWTPSNWTYLEAICHILRERRQRFSLDPLQRAGLSQVLAGCERFESIIDRLAPYLRNQASCKTANDYLQNYSVHLHISFSICICCRPVLWRASDGYLDSLQQQLLVDKCKDQLKRTIQMFLAMNRLSIIPTRSCTFIQAALSSALLLGRITEDDSDPAVWQLLGDLILALSDTATEEQYFPPSSIQNTGDFEILSAISRSFDSLKELYNWSGLSKSNGRQEHAGRASPNTGLISPVSSNQTKYPLEPDELLQPEKSLAMATAETVDEYLADTGHCVQISEDIYQTTLDTLSFYNP